MPNIFVTSDPHSYHKNIAGPKVSAWKAGYRDFNDEFEMTEHIIKVWNQTVKEDDILYGLGDFAFGGFANIWKFRKQLRCKNIHWVYGNHDDHIKNNKQIVVPKEDRNMLEYFGIVDDPYKRYHDISQINCQDLFSSVQDVLEFKAAGEHFFCSHYAHRVWDASHRGVMHLYGHSHGSIADYGKSMDIGIDVAKRLLGDYVPFPIEYIVKRLAKKEVEFPDHHSENTNAK